MKLLVSTKHLMSKCLAIGSLSNGVIFFLPRACSLVQYLPMRFLWLQVNVVSDLLLHLQTLYKFIEIQGVKVGFTLSFLGVILLL